MAVVCFIHSFGVNHYKSILQDYMNRGKNFFDRCDKIFVTYGGEYPSPIPEKANVIKLAAADEIETMNIIYNYCKANPEDKICYIHTKGVTNDNICITEWRDYMFHFCCEQYEDRIKDLDTYDTCGVDKRDNPVTHYSGNFWWSTASHISKLCSPEQTFSPLTVRHKSEFWICSNKDAKHLSLHDCGIDVYERHLHRYPRERYIK